MFLLFFLSSFVSSDHNWKLAWHDEFNYYGRPDPAIFASENEEGIRRNTEIQYYTKNDLKNCRVENGNLVIELLNEPNTTIYNSRIKAYDSYNYSSASIYTRNKIHFLYGKIETSFKIPQGVGIWPAFWFAATKGKLPDCGEIDIMEHVGKQPDNIHFTIHMRGVNNTGASTTKFSKKIVTKEASNRFHNLTLYWNNSHIEWYLDTVLGHSYNKYQQGEDPVTELSWPFDVPFYLRINMALGGVWGGPDIGSNLAEKETKYLLDYIRYYIDENDPNKTDSYRVLNSLLKK